MKNQLIYGLLLLVMIGFLFTNCSIQKRKYRDGFYVSVKKKHVPKTEMSSERSAKVLIKTTPQLAQRKDTKVSVKQELGLMASAEKAGHEHKQKLSVRPLPLVEDSCGDKIVLLDGDEVHCKVYEIGAKNVVYKPCDNLEGPMISKSKEKVFMIKYRNGSKEVFKHEKPAKPPIIYPVPVVSQKKKLSGISLAAFILSLFSWTIIMAPIALVMGIIGKNEIKKHPDTMKGDAFATFAIVISILVIFLVVMLAIAMIG
jgi:hypothetical protein